MKIIETKVYPFSELNEEAKQVAIEQYRNTISQYINPLDMFNDDCIETLKEKGFEGIKLQYSLSYSQGDGLSFSAEKYNIDQLLKSVLGENKEKTASIIKDNLTIVMKGNNGHYCFASKNDIDIYIETGKDLPNIEDIIGKIRTMLENEYMSICKELENNGYAELEYRNSDDAIIEIIEDERYYFKENGKQF